VQAAQTNHGNSVNGKVQLGAPSSPHATQADVAYFQNLLVNGQTMLRGGTTTMAPNKMHVFNKGGLIEETALQLNRAEFALNHLHTKIKSDMNTLDTEEGPTTPMISDIVNMQHSTTMYFVGVTIVGNSGDSVTEASQSITRGR
jgi:hypothetical protein